MHDSPPELANPRASVDPDLEDGLIGAIAADPSYYWLVRERLPAAASDVFAVRREAWEHLARAIESGASPAGLGLAASPTSADPLSAADRLAELYRRRLLAELAEQTLRDIAAARPSREILEDLQSGVAAASALIANSSRVGTLSWGDTLLEDVSHDLDVAQAARAAGQQTLGIPTGLPLLDSVLDGWQRGGLYVLGGPPGIGKTSLALQWACQAALVRGAAVVYFTYENSPANLTLKAIGRLAGVPPAAVEHGRVDPDRWRHGLQRFRGIAPHLALVPADAGTTVEAVESTVRGALARRQAPGLVIVDYLQRMAFGEKFGTLQDNVSALAQRLRDLAVRLELPVLAISALSPSAADNVPLQLSALAARGELEYASDVVLLLGRRAKVGLASAARMRVSPGVVLLDLLLAKNRYGEANRVVPLLFRPATGDFQEEPSVSG